MEEKKYKCPFCGYEMDKKLSRCENCAGILDINAELEDETYEASNCEEEKAVGNAEEKEADKPLVKETQTQAETEKETETTPKKPEEKNTASEKTSSEENDNRSFYGSSFINQPYNAYNIKNTYITPVPKPLTNGMKVALTTLCVLLPVIGQFIGLVLSIIYMNSDEGMKDCDDRRSFGLALLIACIIAFVLSAFGGFILLIIIAANTI